MRVRSTRSSAAIASGTPLARAPSLLAPPAQAAQSHVSAGTPTTCTVTTRTCVASSSGTHAREGLTAPVGAELRPSIATGCARTRSLTTHTCGASSSVCVSATGPTSTTRGSSTERIEELAVIEISSAKAKHEAVKSRHADKTTDKVMERTPQKNDFVKSFVSQNP